MITPWGDTDELRAERLRPGPSGSGGEVSAAHQRRRLLAATVEAVSARGYAASTVADLSRISGVGRGDFYKYFASKQECFFCAVDTLYAEGMRRVKVGYRGEEDWEARMHTAFAALLELLLSQPDASRMCLVDVFEAGPAGAERAERGAAGFERLLRRSLARSEHRAGLPGPVIGGVVRGIQMLIHDRLRRRAGEELPKLMEELLEWGLSYKRPGVPLRRVGRRIPVRKHEPSADPVERLLVAFAEVAAEKGYRAVSVNELAPRAGTSMRTLYDNFDGKEDAFLACAEMARARMRAELEPVYAGAGDWATAIAAGNEALLDFLAAEPALARAAIIEVLAAGPAALEHRDDAIKMYADRLSAGFELAPKVPRIATEAISFGRYALLQQQIARHGPQALPRLGPAMTFFVLAPFLGSEWAAAVANGTTLEVSAEVKVT